MKELIVYQFEVACCLALFYLFYLLLLRKETNFYLRRLYLIGTGIMAFVLPALQIQFSFNSEEIPMEYINILPSNLIASVPIVVQPEKADPWIWISILWGTGCAMMLLRLLFSLSSIGKILKETTHSPEGQAFKITNADVQSFSFFKTIVLNTHHYQSMAMKYILAHEQAHSKQYHSVDVLLLELLKSIQWFNPIAWLYAKESLQNLEYLADKEVSDSLNNSHDYQMAIVQHAHHTESNLLRSEFSKSKLKNRIIMMNSQKSKEISVVKLLLLIPFLGVLLMSFSLKIENLDLRDEISALLPIFNFPSLEINEANNSIRIHKSLAALKLTSAKLDPAVTLFDKADATHSEEDQQARPFCGNMDTYYDQIKWELNYPEYAFRSRISGEVLIEFMVQKDGSLTNINVASGIGFECDEEAMRVIKNGPTWLPALKNGQKLVSKVMIPVLFDLDNNERVQSRLLKGKIISESGAAIENAMVGSPGIMEVTRSDNNGNFEFRLTPEQDKIQVIRAIGWFPKIVDVSNLKKIEIQLKPWPHEAIKKCLEEHAATFASDNNRNRLLIEISDNEAKLIEDPWGVFNAQLIFRHFVKDSIARAQYGESAKGGITIAVPLP